MVVYIQSFLLVILEILCCKIFFEAFGKRRDNKRNLKNYGIILSLIVFVYVIALFLSNQIILKQLLIIVVTALVMTMHFRINYWRSLIFATLFQGLLLAIDYFTLWLNVSIFHSIAEIGESYYVEGYLIAILGKVFLFMVVLVIRERIGGQSSDVLMDTEWLRFIFFPVFTIFTITALLITSGNLANQKQEDLFLVIAFCLAGMNIVVFYLINDILRREAKLRENEIFQLQVRNQTDMYRSISVNFDMQRKKTHEYKNQLMCIESLITSKNYAELEEYVGKISGHLNKELDCINTNNVIVDAILNSIYQETLDKNIAFIFKINDLSKINIRDEDIVVILSNLLNNAIEACEKCIDKKVIKMKFVKEGNKVIISVRNTYNGEIMIQDGELQTSKRQEENEHGIGIGNIMDVITKYGGSHVIQNDKNEFYFSIIIPQ